jgi:predicted O-methyltransferase YrrM
MITGKIVLVFLGKINMKTHKEINGWFDYLDVYDFIISTIPDNGIFVECGAWLGASSSYLCDRAEDRIKVFIVDTWKGSDDELTTTQKLATTTDIYEIFIDNMGDRKFTAIRKPSIEAANDFQDESCDAVYIDMQHTYESVIQDLKAWYPKVKKGGYIAGHDVYLDGVNKAVKEFFGSYYDIIGKCDCSWIVQKV